MRAATSFCVFPGRFARCLRGLASLAWGSGPLPPRPMQSQLGHLGGHVVRIELIDRVAGQAYVRHPGKVIPVPVNDRIQMIEDGIAA